MPIRLAAGVPASDRIFSRFDAASESTRAEGAASRSGAARKTGNDRASGVVDAGRNRLVEEDLRPADRRALLPRNQMHVKVRKDLREDRDVDLLAAGDGADRRACLGDERPERRLLLGRKLVDLLDVPLRREHEPARDRRIFGLGMHDEETAVDGLERSRPDVAARNRALGASLAHAAAKTRSATESKAMACSVSKPSRQSGPYAFARARSWELR